MKYINERRFENLNSRLFKKMVFFMIYSDYIGNREGVAEIGYRLDILVNDPHSIVRYQVARNGYRLDILVNDLDPDVRIEVAKKGYGLDKLINDPESEIRIEVARQGYRLNELVNDPIWEVREIAKGKLNEIYKSRQI